MNKNCDTELAIALLADVPLRCSFYCGYSSGDGYRGDHLGGGRGGVLCRDDGSGTGSGIDFAHTYGDSRIYGFITGYGNCEGGNHQSVDP